ncbi:hypothetical protein F5884DRAFT_758508 [Xylogone sp. PMI_703]|nr:hypothetical protein F5884DRAFT_758508 [Xylogone sp. PMI_703]
MSKNSKNSKNTPKSNAFDLLSELDDDDPSSLTRLPEPREPTLQKLQHRRPQQHYVLMSGPKLKTFSNVALEEFIRNELSPQIGPTPSTNPTLPSPPSSSPPSPPPSIAPGQIPGVGRDLSRVTIPEIKEGNAGTVRKRVNEALKGKGITCLGVNSKGNGRYRLLFRDEDVDKVRRDDVWLKTYFDRGTLYGEQWYPIRVDRAHHKVSTDEMGCTVFGQMNKVKVHKMRWLGNVSVDKEYRSMIIHLDTKRRLTSFLRK